MFRRGLINTITDDMANDSEASEQTEQTNTNESEVEADSTGNEAGLGEDSTDLSSEPGESVEDEIEEPENDSVGLGAISDGPEQKFETFPGQIGAFTIEHSANENEPARVIYWDENNLPQADFEIPEKALQDLSFLDLHRMFFEQEKALQGDQIDNQKQSGKGVAQPIINFLDAKLDEAIDNIAEKVQGEVRGPDMNEIKEQSESQAEIDDDDGDEQEKKSRKEAEKYGEKLQQRGYDVRNAKQAERRESTPPSDMTRDQLERAFVRSLRRIAKLRREAQQAEQEDDEELGAAFENYHQRYEQQITKRTQELKMRQIIPGEIIKKRAQTQAEETALNNLHDDLYGVAEQQPKDVQKKRENKTHEKNEALKTNTTSKPH